MQPNIIKSFHLNAIQYARTSKEGVTVIKTLTAANVPNDCRGGGSVKCSHCKVTIKNAGALKQHEHWAHYNQTTSNLQ